MRNFFLWYRYIRIGNTSYIDSHDIIFLVSSAPQNLTIKGVSHDTATIEWEEPEYPNGIIKSYIVMKWRGSSGMVQLETNIVGKLIRYTINNLDSETTYYIAVSGGA